MGQLLRLDYVGIVTIREKSILLDHFKRHLGRKVPIQFAGMITCNGLISAPRYHGEPIIFGEASLWTPMGKQISCFPGARIVQIKTEAGELHGRPSFYCHYSAPVSEEDCLTEFIRKAYRRPKDMPPIGVKAQKAADDVPGSWSVDRLKTRTR